MGETLAEDLEGPESAGGGCSGGGGGSGAGVRSCEVQRPAKGSCGFHLSRTQWDPYPWVSGVDAGSAAEAAGLLAGDCVLEVNGEDVLGERIGAVAARVRARADKVSLLLWNAGQHPQCNTESLCCGPMPATLQRLSACVAAVVSALECPVCLEPAAPPAYQCANGHLLCGGCRARAERCPVCRLRLARGRSLLADNCFQALSDAFNLKSEAEDVRPAKLREKLFGQRKKVLPAAAEDKPPLASPTNKFLARLMGKACSVENLSSAGGVGVGGREYSADAEFNSLKAKSLSTSEIFRPLTPDVSRAPSLTLHGRLAGTATLAERPASYHGSCDSLSGRLTADFGDRFSSLADDGTLYHCPGDASCPRLLKASTVIQHINECHGGPLVHYFQPRVLWSLPPPLEDSAVVAVTGLEGATFFMVVERAGEDTNPGSAGWHAWAWLLGSRRATESFVASATVRAGPRETRHALPVLSLATTSRADARKGRLGLELSDEALRRDFPAEARSACALGLLLEVREAPPPPSPPPRPRPPPHAHRPPPAESL